jgi:NodT family efflux transporter outer membrane factor (OMF) lipoprotein
MTPTTLAKPLWLSKLLGQHATAGTHLAPAYTPQHGGNGEISNDTLPQWQEGQTLPFTQGLVFNTNFPDKDWWTAFNDPLLNQYLVQALSNSHTLKQATLRIEESQALADITRANQLPRLTLGPSFNRQRNSATLVSPSLRQTGFGGSGTTSGGAATAPAARIFAPGQVLNIYNAPLNASYDLDYLLRNRVLTLADRYAVVANQHERRTAQLTLSASVAQTYVSLLLADYQVGLQQQAISLAQQALGLAVAKYQAGLTTGQTLNGLKATLQQAQAQLPERLRVQSTTARALAVLLGQSSANALQLPRSNWDTFVAHAPWPQSIASGLPSQLLTRRPDIGTQEALLTRQQLLVSAARRHLFPSITLTGQFGFASTRLKDWFKWDSRILGVGGNLSQDLFAGGAKIADLKRNKLTYQRQLEQYQQTLLLAFQAVEDAMASVKRSVAKAQQEAQQLQTLTDTLALQQASYQAGLTAYDTVVNQQQSVLTLKQVYVQSVGQRWLDLISLYQQTGGGV